ncbi:MAG TPA: pyruvate kinase [Rhodobacteraceae bacterium]|nr:pyruvate kinase [Paracoccaceae bacterium]
MKRNRRAKIVATVGPASSSPEMLKKLFLEGVDVFRLNFSHGTHEDHRKVFEALRELEEELNRPIAVLQDLQGPKIRVGTIKDGKLAIKAGDKLRFVPGGEQGDLASIPLPHPEIFAAIETGHKLMIDDGRLRLTVTAHGSDFIEAEANVGGVISDRKGVNLPDTILELSPLTDKDRKDLEFGLEIGVDWVALSFVQKPSDVEEARALIGKKARLMAKIEKPSALEYIEEIVPLTDGIMVARGDLGVEIPPEEVPGRQKELIRICRMIGKPVVVATQMLDSMVAAPAPTRAEASDVATAIYDGASAVMLSQESAVGEYVVETVSMMDNIIFKTEHHSAYEQIISALQPEVKKTPQRVLAASSAAIARTINAKAIVTFTSSGSTAARIARQRVPVPTLAITPSKATARQLCLFWGVQAIASPDITSYDEMVDMSRLHTKRSGFGVEGDKIVVLAGIPFGRPGTTNNLRVVTL